LKPVEHTAEVPCRLLAAVRKITDLSNQKARQAIRTGKLTVDGTRILDPGHQVAAGQKIRLDWTAPRPQKTEPLGATLVHREANILIIDKPAGLLSTPTMAQEARTAVTAARTLCTGGKPPVVIHRLDKATSGLLIFARGTKMARLLRAAIDARDVERTYYCVVKGQPRLAEGTIVSALLRDAGHGRRGSRRGTFRVLRAGEKLPEPDTGAGKWAVTHYRSVGQAEGKTALEVSLGTGRTHQIRIHLAEAGCPILGERVYDRGTDEHRQALHAGRVSFVHPYSGKSLSFRSPWPPDLGNVTPIGSTW